MYTLYKKASRSSAQKMRTTFLTALRKARNTKRFANDSGCAGDLERAVVVEPRDYG